VTAQLQPLRAPRRRRLAGIARMLARIAWGTLSVVLFVLGFMASWMVTSALSERLDGKVDHSLWPAVIGALVGSAVAGFGGAISSGKTVSRRDLVAYWFAAFMMLLALNLPVFSFEAAFAFALCFVVGRTLRRVMGWGESAYGEGQPRSVRQMRLDALRGMDARGEQQENIEPKKLA